MAKIGRPTKYTDEMPERVYECLASGKSVLQFSVEVGVCRDTVYEWAKQHPAFSDALSRAQQASEAHWERRLEDLMCDRNANAPLVKLYFANRFGWRDKQELSGPDGGPISHVTKVEFV